MCNVFLAAGVTPGACRAVLALVLSLWAVIAEAFEIEEETWFPGGGEQELRILSSTDTSAFLPLIESYRTARPDVSIRYVVANTQQIFRAMTAPDTRFDLTISSAMDLQMKLVNDGLAASHDSPDTQALPAWARWRDQLFGFTQEPVVMALSRRALGDLPLPESREDLIGLMRAHPDLFRGRIGTYDPRASGAGYMFAAQDARQSDTFWRLSEVMGGLEPRLYGSTGAMIDDLQSGRLVLAYNVLGSYLTQRLQGWEDGAMVEPRDFTQVLLRTAFVPSTASAPDLGRSFLDFLVSEAGQGVLRRQTGFSPIDENALAAAPHLRPIRLDPGLLIYVDPLKKARFLREWAAALRQ